MDSMFWLILGFFPALAAAGLSLPSEEKIAGDVLRWYDLKDERWEVPTGNRYSVSTSNDINDLQPRLRPGDVIVMRNKEWRDPAITLTARGSSGSGNMIYLVPETYGGVKLTGEVKIDIRGSYIEVRGLWIDGRSSKKRSNAIDFNKGSRKCRFTNSAITNYNPNSFDKKYHWVEIWGSEHTIDYNTFEDKLGLGQLVRVKTENDRVKPPGSAPDSWGHKILYNYFGPRADTGQDDGEAIQIGLKESEFVITDTTIQFNYFYRYSAEIECISVKAGGNRVQYNSFRRSECTVTLRHGDNSRVEHNYFYCQSANGCGGIRVYGSDHRVYNNYIDKAVSRISGRGAINLHSAYSGPMTRPARNISVETNLLYFCENCLNIGFSDREQHPRDNIYEKNILYGATSNSYCLRERSSQANPMFTQNVCGRGQIDNYDRYEDGFRRRNPAFRYDDEWQIYRPTDAGIVFSMKHKPVGRGDVGPTWRTG